MAVHLNLMLSKHFLG